MNHVQIDRLDIAYRELGEGPPVVLLHGWPTSSLLWRDVMPALARHHRVIAPDLPGFGGSSKPPGGYDFLRFERVLDGLLQALDIDQTALVGHDLGGPIAMHWALARRDRVTAIALLNTLLYPELAPEVIEFAVALMDPERRGELTSPAGLADIMRLGVSDDFALGDDVIAGIQAPFATAADRDALAAAGVGLGIPGFAEIAVGLPSLTQPLRVIYGVQDRVLPDIATTVERLQRDVPHAQVTALAGCGHFVTEQAPARVGELLTEFLAVSVPSPTPG
jgi:pimeloyl-ACP methyl ester carboxylesterase